MKIRDAVLSCALCLFVSGPLLLLGAQKVCSLELPSWLTAEDAARLAGGISGESVRDNLSIAGFRNGRLQEAVSDVLSNHIPMKALALETDSALDDAMIGLGKKLFGFDFRLTGTDRGFLHLDSVDALAYVPAELTQSQMQGIDVFMAGVTSYAEEHSNIEVLVYVVGGFQNPAVSPYYAVDPARSFDRVVSLFEAAKGSLPNLHLLSSSYDSLEDYYRDFFHTDHHWNARGMQKAYAEIGEALGLPVVENGETVIFDGYRFGGSLARAALSDMTEVPFDLKYDFSSLRRLNAQGDVVGDLVAADYWDTVEPGQIDDFYNKYYSTFAYDAIVGGGSDRTTCLIADSYGTGIERLLALSSGKLVKTNDLHPAQFADGATLESRVEDSGADTVVFIASPIDYAILGSDHPEYFE